MRLNLVLLLLLLLLLLFLLLLLLLLRHGCKTRHGYCLYAAKSSPFQDDYLAHMYLKLCLKLQRWNFSTLWPQNPKVKGSRGPMKTSLFSCSLRTTVASGFKLCTLKVNITRIKLCTILTRKIHMARAPLAKM